MVDTWGRNKPSTDCWASLSFTVTLLAIEDFKKEIIDVAIAFSSLAFRDISNFFVANFFCWPFLERTNLRTLHCLSASSLSTLHYSMKALNLSFLTFNRKIPLDASRALSTKRDISPVYLLKSNQYHDPDTLAKFLNNFTCVSFVRVMVHFSLYRSFVIDGQSLDQFHQRACGARSGSKK